MRRLLLVALPLVVGCATTDQPPGVDRDVGVETSTDTSTTFDSAATDSADTSADTSTSDSGSVDTEPSVDSAPTDVGPPKYCGVLPAVLAGSCVGNAGDKSLPTCAEVWVDGKNYKASDYDGTYAPGVGSWCFLPRIWKPGEKCPRGPEILHSCRVPESVETDGKGGTVACVNRWDLFYTFLDGASVDTAKALCKTHGGTEVAPP